MPDLLEQADDQPQLKYTPYRKKLRRYGIATEIVQPEDPTIRYIPLTRGMYAIVDAFLYEWLMLFNWIAVYDPKVKAFYAKRTPALIENYGATAISMHRMIIGAARSDKRRVDHKNRNTLDNGGCNLRFADMAQSMCNQGLRCTNKSGYRGVHRTPTGHCIASASFHGVRHYLGFFAPDRIEDAARAYDRKALELQGEFAVLNFPEEHGRTA